MVLNEATVNQLINKSRRADLVKSYNSTRFDRRLVQKVAKSVGSFNRIDFNSLFKADLLQFKVAVQGETSKYDVIILFKNICRSIKKEIKANKGKFEYKCVYRAIVDAILNFDIYVSCQCGDWKYRQAYMATKGKYNSGYIENRPSKITNPNDTKGAGCKHVLAVIGNLDWALKLATSIFNYINYMQKSNKIKYDNVIKPVLYDNVSADQEEPQDQQEEPEVEQPEETEGENQ